jgi:penicillin-binding protein 1A
MMKLVRRLGTLIYFLLLAAGLGAMTAGILFFVTVRQLPRVPEPLSRIIETPPTEIFAASGERIMLLGGREVVSLNQVSPALIQAVIATEDHRFWSHHGVDKLRTLKALWVTLLQPGKIQGASTITQQLAKNLFFSYQRTYTRKFREMMVALQIEARFEKAEILEAYLNQIPFGVGAFGVEQAARTFFGKRAQELNLAESALLAGLPKSPTRYNPLRYFERAKQRQKTVLARMVAVGYITSAEAGAAHAQALELRPQAADARTGSYFLDVVLKKLEERYGADVVYHGGLKVFTTLNPQQQAWAVASLQKGLRHLDQTLGLPPAEDGFNDDQDLRPQGALVAVETRSGAVRALVGGRDYARSEYNRAVQNNRQPGSGFKPMLYYAAIEKLGLTPATVFSDHRVTFPVAGASDWKPRNFTDKYEGPMVLKKALMQSKNSVAAQLIDAVGPAAVIDVARRCGIQSPLSPVYSLALGTSGVSPLEMAAAFATFATGGIRHTPFLVQRVEDPFGRILDERIIAAKRTLDAEIAYQVVDMLRGVVDNGTARVIRRLGFDLPAAGKTGTTDDYRDAWFIGFTPEVSVSVWVGHDRGVGMRDTRGRGITGGRGAAPIWADFMLKVTQGEPRREFTVPEGIRFEKVSAKTGQVAGLFESDYVTVALRKGQKIVGADGRVPGSRIVEHDLN